MEENIKIMPTVFAVGDIYQIFVPLEFDGIITVSVGGETFYDDSNGILRSNILIHRVDVPMEKLDKACEYTVFCRKMIDRKPYFPVSEEPFSETFKFKPVRGEKINIYHIADAHNMEAQPIAAGKYFGEDLDLLILNGDIPNHSGDIANFNSIYRIAYGITGGGVPVVFARGNHDTRGIYAEEFERYTPCDNQKPYFTFRLGSLWGMVLDCGEDKLDTHEEYANTVCFHNYRLRQTDFIKKVIENSQNEYNADGVENKIIVCHIPFTTNFEPPFNIEEEIYGEWTRLIGDNIEPDLFFFGHTHTYGVYKVGGAFDYYGQSCPAVIGSEPRSKEDSFIGCGVTMGGGAPKIIFNDEKLNVLEMREE